MRNDDDDESYSIRHRTDVPPGGRGRRVGKGGLICRTFGFERPNLSGFYNIQRMEPERREVRNFTSQLFLQYTTYGGGFEISLHNFDYSSFVEILF